MGNVCGTIRMQEKVAISSKLPYTIIHNCQKTTGYKGLILYRDAFGVLVVRA